MSQAATEADVFRTLQDRRLLAQQISEEIASDGKVGERLGAGAFGIVHLATLESGYQYAVKTTVVAHPTVMMEGGRNTLEEAEEMDQPGFIDRHLEYESSMMQSYAQYDCPNLPILYSHRLLKVEDEPTMRMLEMSMELYDFSLRDYRSIPEAERTTELWDNFLFQLLDALHLLHYLLKVLHTDIRANNVLVKRITPGGYWRYTIMGIDYYVPNLGYLVVLADLGENIRMLGSGLNSALFTWLLIQGLNASYVNIVGKTLETIPGKQVGDLGLIVFGGKVSSAEQAEQLQSGELFPAQASYDTQDLLAIFLGGEISRFISKVEGKRVAGEFLRDVVSAQFTKQLANYRAPVELRWEGFNPWKKSEQPKVYGEVDLRFLLPRYLMMDYFTRFTDYREPLTAEGSKKPVIADYQLS